MVQHITLEKSKQKASKTRQTNNCSVCHSETRNIERTRRRLMGEEKPTADNNN